MKKGLTVITLAIGLVVTVTLSTSQISLVSASPCSTEPTTIESTDGRSYTVLQFKTVGTCEWTVPSRVSVIDALVVAGGGGGNASSGVGGDGGGGAGGRAGIGSPGLENTGGGGGGAGGSGWTGGDGDSGVVIVRYITPPTITDTNGIVMLVDARSESVPIPYLTVTSGAASRICFDLKSSDDDLLTLKTFSNTNTDSDKFRMAVTFGDVTVGNDAKITASRTNTQALFKEKCLK